MEFTGSLKVNNTDTQIRCEICLELKVKTPERSHWRWSGVFIVNFEHISHFVLNFEHVIAGSKPFHGKSKPYGMFSDICLYDARVLFPEAVTRGVLSKKMLIWQILQESTCVRVSV